MAVVLDLENCCKSATDRKTASFEKIIFLTTVIILRCQYEISYHYPMTSETSTSTNTASHLLRVVHSQLN